MKYTTSIILSALLLAQCSPARIALTGSEWENKETYDVKGRQGILINQKLSFGNYHTDKVQRSWTKGNSGSVGVGKGNPGTPDYTSIISYEYINRKQTIRFTLNDAVGKQADVYCVSKFKARDLYLGDQNNPGLSVGIDLLGLRGKKDANLYYVQLYTGKSEEPWQLILDNAAAQEEAKKYTGYLTKSNGDYYKIVPVTKVLNKNGKVLTMPFGSMGFEFRDQDDKPLAAVSTADNGIVYFNATLSNEEKLLLASACTAILLQQELG